MECLQFGSVEELTARFKNSREFQKTHNALVADIVKLYKIATAVESFIQPTLIRALYKEFFSMVEADLYLINQFNPYQGYDDKETIVPKFKKTYRKHSQDFKKAGIHQQYQSAEFRYFLTMVSKRHGFTHPKGRHSIKVVVDDITLFKKVFDTYRAHINTLMTDVGFEIHLPPSTSQAEFDALMKKLLSEDI
jgi:hypothetical protein